MVSPVLLALDFSDLERARSLASRLIEHVAGYKVGLELLMAEGPRAVTEIAGLGLPVFADAKLHDIPTTVRGAASGLSRAGARWVTAHASGGRQMLEAAIDGMSDGPAEASGILAVTVLTSMDAEDLISVGVAGSMEHHVQQLASLASGSGAEGVICSPHEIATVKEVSPDLLAVTPGIRTSGASRDDQKRAMTPEAALEMGADLLVIGRSITAAPDPVTAAAEIAKSLGDNPD